MKTKLKTTLLGLALGLAGIGSASAANVAIACGAIGQEHELCKQGAEAWAKKTGNTVSFVSVPNSATEQLALFQQLLSAGAADIDVMQIDVVWPGIIGRHLLDLTPYAKNRGDFFAAMIKNDTVEGKLVALPWFTDAGLLYYRKDLLEKYQAKVPTTWAELTATAQKIQDGERRAGNDKAWGYVWQGRAYEGLTCNALEWVASHNGGSIVDSAGKVTINNPGAAAALKTAAGWVGKITPQGVLNYTEEESRGVFQSGNAVFMRNWPYAWSLANGADSPIKGKVGVAPLPSGAGGKPAATLGGQQLAVSKYSKNAALAADLVVYLTGREEQKRRAIQGSLNPTIGALYIDPDVVKANPFMRELYPVFASAVARPATPTGAKYNQVSTEFWNAVHATLSGQQPAEASLKALDGKLNRLGRGGKW
ncbi:ABC transporter substrate-binding protein [Chitinimonas koreensis]|uniref:ABC transporter substrate-binding protein n=1 Tax=Chitinimonas koreensis TaxID=356302 RepID=UPI0003FD7AC0|nr:ABC transporter substrate-binding protein [Chitinimonas koreensis]QNM98518.1 ABC transporter substrate-binding protein [Chitinimonas koreensis]